MRAGTSLPGLNLGDNLVVTAPIGLFLGRCANFINGELYGRVTNVPWAMQFPKELLDASTMKPTRALAACSANRSVDHARTRSLRRCVTNPQVADVLRGILTPGIPRSSTKLPRRVVLFAILWFVRTRSRTPNGFFTGLFMICLRDLSNHGRKFSGTGCARSSECSPADSSFRFSDRSGHRLSSWSPKLRPTYPTRSHRRG